MERKDKDNCVVTWETDLRNMCKEQNAPDQSAHQCSLVRDFVLRDILQFP